MVSVKDGGKDTNLLWRPNLGAETTPFMSIDASTAYPPSVSLTSEVDHQISVPMTAHPLLHH